MVQLQRKAGVARLELLAVRAAVVLVRLPDTGFAPDAPALRLQPRQLLQQESSRPNHCERALIALSERVGRRQTVRGGRGAHG